MVEKGCGAILIRGVRRFVVWEKVAPSCIDIVSAEDPFFIAYFCWNFFEQKGGWMRELIFVFRFGHRWIVGLRDETFDMYDI